MNGIGPEVALKALSMLPPPDSTAVVLLGPPQIWTYYAGRLPGMPQMMQPVSSITEIQAPGIYIWNFLTEEHLPSPRPGRLTAESGRISMLCIEKAASLCIKGDAAAMVTAPISKEAVNLAGYHIPGHTEFLAEKDGTPDVAMMLVHNGLRVIPLTTHIPLADVAQAIETDRITRKTHIIHKSLKRDFGIGSPKIAILGLNPHAGDGGVIGREELDIITPAITELNEAGITCEGPFPADGFFAGGMYKKFDAVLAMYHDQGLIPFKTLAFGKGVNMTAGLSFIRTSPDHGTAFGIAGTNQAEPGSMTEAITLALKLARLRQPEPEY